MKICLITSVYALTEEDRHASFLVECNQRLISRGHEVTVLAPSYRGMADHVVHGVQVHRFRYFPRRWETLTHGQGAPSRVGRPGYFLMAGIYVLFGLIATLRLCRRKEFDVIHVQWPFPHAIWGVVASRLYRIPVVFTFHGAELLLGKRFGFVNTVLKWTIPFASALTCNSRFTAAKVEALGGRGVEILPYGATVPVRQVEKDLQKEVCDVLFVGRLIQRKGLRYLLEALPLVLTRVQHARLHVVGKGPELQNCKNLARSLGVADHVFFHGIVTNDRLAELYQRADVFVLPAIIDDNGDTEGLGVVLIEALSFNTPVVASAVGGIADIIQSGETGLLVPEKSPAALADAITRVLVDKAFAGEIAAAGRTRATAHFSWERIISCLESIYLRAAGGLRLQSSVSAMANGESKR
jgi:glycosyltransferase involved in cell wall biosynthesis